MLSRVSTAALVLLLAMTTACLPLPHRVQAFPAVQGAVLESGLAVAGARIFSAANPEGAICEDTKHATTTDEEGAFTLEPEKDLRFFMVIGDPLSTWTVCIEHAGRRYLGWANFSIGYAPEAVVMECDLADPVEERAEGEGLCTVYPSTQTSDAGG